MTGGPTMLATRPTARTTTCSVDGCERPPVARGWCHAHYDRWYHRGDAVPDVPIGSLSVRTPCAVDGCDRPIYSTESGLCKTHRNRQLANGTTDLVDEWFPGLPGNPWAGH